jgi:hypothetical protein
MTPKARQTGLLLQPVGEQLVVYDQLRGRLHVLNRTATLVWRNCDGERTMAELIALVSQELEIAADEGLIWLALGRLQRARLLERRVAPPPAVVNSSRRELLRRSAGVAASALLPTVLSLVPPASAHAASKVLVCHQGQTIEVDERSLAAHLAHGDTPGPCTGTTEPPTTTSAATTTPPPTTTSGATTTTGTAAPTVPNRLG